VRQLRDMGLIKKLVEEVVNEFNEEDVDIDSL
jgi:hypothetical protein